MCSMLAVSLSSLQNQMLSQYVQISSAIPDGLCHLLRATLHHIGMIHSFSDRSSLPAGGYLNAPD